MEITDVQAVDIAGLPEHQKAFRIDTGELVVVETTQKEIGDNPQNLTPEHHIALRVRAWKAKDDGTPEEDAAGLPLEIPHKVHSIVSAALAEGTVNLENALVQFTLDALQRTKTWLVVKRHMARIPVGSS